MSAAEQAPPTDRDQHTGDNFSLSAKWYLRSTADRDTHRGLLLRNGTVMADCGVVFKPLKALRDRGPALPGYPPDPGQVCPTCKGVVR